MSILITGAGMVGTAAAKCLIERGEHPVLFDVAASPALVSDIVDLDQVTIVQGDVGNFAEVMRAIVEHQVTGVIHTAALLTPGTRARPLAGLNVNVVGTANVMEASRLAGAGRVVICSSSMLYMGDSAAQTRDEPYAEDVQFRLISDRPPSIYGSMKLFNEHMGLYYNDLYDTHFAAVRLPCVFGPWRGGNTGGLGKDIRALVEGAVMHGNAVADYPPDRWVGPDEYIYSKDAGRALVAALFAQSLTQHVFNIAMRERHTFSDIVNVARAVFPDAEINLVEREIDWRGLPPYGRRQPFDTTAAREQLMFEPEYDLAASLIDYGEWIQASFAQG